MAQFGTVNMAAYLRKMAIDGNIVKLDLHGIFYCLSWIFGIAGTVLGILGVIILITESLKNGIIVLILAAIASHVGLPNGCRLGAQLASVTEIQNQKKFTEGENEK